MAEKDDKRASRKRPIPAWQKAEADKLRAIWDMRAQRTQTAFGAAAGIENGQAMVWQLLNGSRPLNLEWARRFQAELGCQIAEFSERLAQEDARQRRIAEWPLQHISIEEWRALDAGERLQLEAAMLSRLGELRSADTKSGTDPAPS